MHNNMAFRRCVLECGLSNRCLVQKTCDINRIETAFLVYAYSFVFMWHFKSNVFLQWTHPNFLIPVCSKICCLKLSLRVNDFLQRLHEKGFSPVWHFKCLLKIEIGTYVWMFCHTNCKSVVCLEYEFGELMPYYKIGIAELRYVYWYVLVNFALNLALCHMT